MKAPEDPVGSVAAVLERHGSALRGLFSRYCDGSPTWPLAKRRLHQDQFLRFARDFKLCPGLMPRVELLQLFRGVQGTAKPVVVAPDTARPLLSYDEFVMVLAGISSVIFSGPEWSASYDRPEQKLQLLLFWMDQGSAVFQGNGRDLLECLVGTAAADDRGSRAPERAERAHAPSSVISSLPLPSDLDTLPRLEHLDHELTELFAYYCTYGERLNVGPSAAISRSQVTRLLSDARVIDTPRAKAEVDVILARLGARRRRLTYDEFYVLLAEVAARKFPALARGGTRAVALHALLVRHLLPAAARLAAVRAERGELRQSPPPPAASGSTPEAWASRAQSIDSLYHELLSPHTAAAFGISGAEGAPTPSTAQMMPAQDGRASDPHQPPRPPPTAAVTNPRDAAAPTPGETANAPREQPTLLEQARRGGHVDLHAEGAATEEAQQVVAPSFLAAAGDAVSTAADFGGDTNEDEPAPMLSMVDLVTRSLSSIRCVAATPPASPPVHRPSLSLSPLVGHSRVSSGSPPAAFAVSQLPKKPCLKGSNGMAWNRMMTRRHRRSLPRP